MTHGALALALAIADCDILGRLIDCGCTAEIAENCERARPASHDVPMFEEWSDASRACPCR